MIKKTWLFLILLLKPTIQCTVTPYFNIRSQSENAARELVGAGWNYQIDLCNPDCCYGNISITPEYTRSFRSYQIAQALFGCCEQPCNLHGIATGDTSGESCCSPCGLYYNSCRRSSSACQQSGSDDGYRINITGSHVNDRGENDWLADYFGLPTDYDSCISYKPRIENILADINLYLGLNHWIDGLYLRVHAPITHTRWNLNMCECIKNPGNQNHWAGYFNKTLTLVGTSTYGITRNNLVPNFTSFIAGCSAINSSDITMFPLRYAKMDCSTHKETGLSDLQMALGINFYSGCDHNIGFSLRVVAPTGNRPQACYLFEPIIGNGKHWEVGGGFNSFWTWWKSNDECRSSSLHVDVHATHLFKTRQCRTFDLCCKPLSRYMLAAHFTNNVHNLKAGNIEGNATIPSNQFDGIYSPIANLTTIPVDVSIGVQGDIVLMLQYIHNNWSFDVGYNFWAKSCENIDYPCDCCSCFEENAWALKGDAFMYGFAQTSPSAAVALSASESFATLHKGTNNYPEGEGSITPPINWYQNPWVDNKQKSWNSNGDTLIIFDPSSIPAQVYTSKNPVFIKWCDIDLCSAATRGYSHKLFGHIDYTWCSCHRCTPYLGLGLEAEFAQEPCDTCNPYSSCCYSCNLCHIPHDSPCCSPCCDNACCTPCTLCAVSQWGVWLKGGLAFN